MLCGTATNGFPVSFVREMANKWQIVAIYINNIYGRCIVEMCFSAMGGLVMQERCDGRLLVGALLEESA